MTRKEMTSKEIANLLYADERKQPDIGDVRLVYGRRDRTVILQSFSDWEYPQLTATEARELAAALQHMADMLDKVSQAD